jgi:alpha-aminoadipate carrier protein LysW
VAVKIDFDSQALDTAARATKYYQCALIERRGIMVLCPECENNLDLDEDGVDEGEVVSCPECGTDFEVVTVSPIELKPMEEAKYEEDDAEEETEDGDYS